MRARRTSLDVSGECSDLTTILAVVCWLAGIVLAKGFGAVVAILIPPYGWYLVVERVMQAIGAVP